MNKLLISFLLAWQGILPLAAQNYQAIRSDRIAYFSDPGGYVSCIRIDSVAVKTDSIFYSFPNIGQTDYGCYTPYGTSWIGIKIVVQKDGYTLFFNEAGDTIKIKTNAALNESWISYKLRDSTIIMAEVIKMDTLGFLGLSDSVKTIGFKVYDKSMSLLNHPLNDMKILLSKNFGLVQTLNFKNFPESGPNDFANEPFQEFNLAGLSNPKKGIQNLTWFEVNDFQVGDEIHTESESGTFGNDRTIIDKIEIYLNRTNYNDSIVYRIDRTQSNHRVWPEPATWAYWHDTIKSVIRKDPDFDRLPGEPVISGDGAYSNYMNMNYKSKTIPSMFGWIWPTSDSCWTNCCVDGCFSSYSFIKGLGGPYYGSESDFCIGSSELVYYKKGSVTWGTPLVISGIDSHSELRTISLYPNPATDKIWIKAEEANVPFTFELIDIKGNTLLSLEIRNTNTSVDVRKFGKGVFLFRFHERNGVIGSGKLILE